MRRATIALDQIEPGLGPLVIADPDLTLPGKLALLYVLSYPQQIHERQDLADVDQQVADHLDEVLHELVGRNWLATIPPDAPPCLAARFQLLQDHDPDQDPPSLDGHRAGVVDVARGIGDELAIDPHSARGDQLLCPAA
jgi:hypothetical protein